MDEHNLSRGLLDDAENPMGRSIDNDGIIKGGLRSRSPSEEQGMLGMYTEWDGDEETATTAGYTDLDRRYLNYYQYYVNKGFRNILIKGLLDYITVLVVGLVLLMAIVAIDYTQLEGRIINGSSCEGEEEDLFTVDCFGNHPIDFGRLKQMSGFANFIIVVLSILWSIFVLQFLRRIPEFSHARDYYEKTLKISHRQLQTIEWPAVLVKMVANYGGAMDPLKITHLITRRDNFYIALITEEIINTDLQITCYGKRTFMTDSFLWVLRGILDKVIFGESWNSFFCRDTATRNTVVATEATKAKLRSALRLCGAGTLLLAPFLLVARLSVFFFRHSDQLRKSSGPLSARHWSPHAQIKLRDYCEVEHIFLQRMHKAHKPASLYVSLFTSSTSVIFARFFAFAFGCIFILLVALGFVYDEDFLFQELSRDRSVTWWLGVLGMLLAALHSTVPDENLVFEPAQLLQEARQHTHFYGDVDATKAAEAAAERGAGAACHEGNGLAEDGWEGNEASLDTLNEFTELFQLKAVTLVEEIFGVLIIPYLLIFRIPDDVDKIINYFYENHVELTYTDTDTNETHGLGHVCKLANLKEAGNPEILTERGMAASLGASHTIIDVEQGAGSGIGDDGSTVIAARRSKSKMMQSMISFTDQHSTWQPDGAGQTVIRQIDSAAWGRGNSNYPVNPAHRLRNGGGAGRWGSGSRNAGVGGGNGGGWRSRPQQAPRSRLEMFYSTDFQDGFSEPASPMPPVTEQLAEQYATTAPPRTEHHDPSHRSHAHADEQPSVPAPPQQQHDHYAHTGPAGSDHALSNSMTIAAEERERQVAEVQRLEEEQHRLQMQLNSSNSALNGAGASGMDVAASGGGDASALPAAARAMPYDDEMHFQDGPPGSLHADVPYPNGGP